jgi:hypothetical protein
MSGIKTSYMNAICTHQQTNVSGVVGEWILMLFKFSNFY